MSSNECRNVETVRSWCNEGFMIAFLTEPGRKDTRTIDVDFALA